MNHDNYWKEVKCEAEKALTELTYNMRGVRHV